MAKPTQRTAMEVAQRTKSTIVPVEESVPRRPYLQAGTQQSVDFGAKSVESAQPEQTSNRRRSMLRQKMAMIEEAIVGKRKTVRQPAGEPVASASAPNVATAESNSTANQVIHKPKPKPNPKPNSKPNSKPKLDAKSIERMIDDRIGKWRPAAWEDDISRNALDTKPFVNLAAPCELPFEEFERASHFCEYVLSQMDQPAWQAMIQRDRLPTPSPEDREGYSPGFDGVYWMSGLTDYLKIMEVAARYGVEPKSCFDFGCASGRVLRHFAVQSKLKSVWGSDINHRHVRWLEQYMPMQVRPLFNHCIPTIPIADNSIDIVSAFSVFTHIDTFESCWLAELNRILSPGGLCYLTVHNEDTWQVIRNEIDNPNNRLVQSLAKIDPEFTSKIHQPLPDRRSVYRFTNFGPYRAQVFHSNNYLKRVWGRMFEIREIIPCHHVRQSVVVLQKRS